MARVSTDFAARLPRSYAIAREGMEAGLHLGLQACIAVRDEIVADVVLGESRPGVAMTSETLMLWLSATKPVTAAAVMSVVEHGLLKLHDRVAEHIPEFAQGGKEAITLWHLLTHTSGFRWTDLGDAETTWDEIIDRICRAKIERDWTPGGKAGYHPYTSWYILGELIRRTTGVPFSDYVREAIFEPLAMPDCWIGMPLEIYDAYGSRVGELAVTEKPGQPPHRLSLRSGIALGAPGASGIGPMRQLVHFYEMLANRGQRGGVRVLSTASVDQMRSLVRQGMFDETFKKVIDWGLGLILNTHSPGDDSIPYGYGKFASRRAYGHSGNQSSVAFADPEHELIAAVVFNGMCGEVKHQQRMRTFLAALYEDLGFVSTIEAAR